MTITNEMVESYAEELLTMTEDVSYPRLVVIYKDGSMDSGFFDNSLRHRYNGEDIIGKIKISEALTEIGEMSKSDVVSCYGDELYCVLEEAITEHSKDKMY